MNKLFVTLALAAVCLTGCGKSLGNQLAIGWTTHNASVAVVTELNEQELIPLSAVKEYRSYQVPVLSGLNSATEDYLDGDGDFTQTKLILDMIGPMLDRMLEIEEATNGTN